MGRVKDVRNCKICGEEFGIIDDRGCRKYCSEKCSKKARNKYNKEWNKKNRKEWDKKNRKEYRLKPEVKAREKEYRSRSEVKAHYKEYHKGYRKRPGPKIYYKEYRERAEVKVRRRLYLQCRRKDPIFRLNKNIGTAIYLSLRKNKLSKAGRKWEKLAGYTKKQLREHLEKLFIKGMSWDNYGKWHIDHIIPIDFFQYTSTDDVEFKMCWRLENLQPLWAEDNIRKTNNY